MPTVTEDVLTNLPHLTSTPPEGRPMPNPSPSPLPTWKPKHSPPLECFYAYQTANCVLCARRLVGTFAQTSQVGVTTNVDPEQLQPHHSPSLLTLLARQIFRNRPMLPHCHETTELIIFEETKLRVAMQELLMYCRVYILFSNSYLPN
jgi:hypothetical protein